MANLIYTHLSKLGSILVLKIVNPRPLSFRLFKQNYTTKIFDKCPFSIKNWELNPRPSKHDSPPITTRSGLPPLGSILERLLVIVGRIKLYVCGFIKGVCVVVLNTCTIFGQHIVRSILLMI